MLKFMTENCAHMLESEEYLLNKANEDGFKGNALNDDGEAVVRDKHGYEIALSDMIRVDDLESLVAYYKDIPEENIKALRNSFFSVYKYIDPEEMIKARAQESREMIDNIDFLEQLAGGW